MTERFEVTKENGRLLIRVDGAVLFSIGDWYEVKELQRKIDDKAQETFGTDYTDPMWDE